MKRSQQQQQQQSTRAPSPTPTAFSGISNYRNESYRPIREKSSSSSSAANPNPNAPAVPSVDARIIARTHFDELSRYLAAYLARAPANSRSTARQKLTRLTKQQFQELSTDVYDELVRRKKNSSENEVPFLPLRDDFHPKRNQARQKLATLPTTRFEDLSSDVYYELARRYPEFPEESNEQQPSPSSAYDDVPSPDFPNNARSPPSASVVPRNNGRISEDRALDSGYGGSSSGRKASEDSYAPSVGGPRRRPSEDEYAPRRSEDAYSGVGRSSEDTTYPASISSSSRRKQSQDTTTTPRRSEVTDRPFPGRGISQISDSTSTTNANATSATSGMIIPNKSTIAEEDIEVPYGRELRESGGSTAVDDRERGDRGDTDDGEGGGGAESASDYPKSPFGGLSGLSARLRGADDDDDGGGGGGAGGETRSGEDYYDKMSLGRASVASDRSAGVISRFGNNTGGSGSGRGSALGGAAGGAAGEEQEKLKRDYEYKIATMQSKIAGLERDLGGRGEKDKKRETKWAEGEERVRVMEEELVGLRKRAEEQSTTMRALQKELDELRRDKERDTRRAREDEEELQILRERCESLEEERRSRSSGTDPEILDQLRADMEGLLTELSDLSRRNDELMTAKDSDLIVIRDMDTQLKEYKRKYEQAKTELRSVKATSQLFLQAPKMDDQLPVSADGGLLDIHVTAFLSAIDGLLTAGRSNAPTRVLTPMKSVVNSVSAIVEDVRLFERRPQRERSDVDLDVLRSLRERAEATLSNLVTASKTHATSLGMSPVSLLDAAASHVSATITDIGRTVCVRKATRAEQDEFAPSATSPPPPPNSSATNGFSPALRSVEEIKPLHHHLKKASTASSSSRRAADAFGSRFGDSRAAAAAAPRSLVEDTRRLASEPSSSDTNSPPPIFDQPPSRSAGGLMSDDSANAEGSEDAWAELKPYLEAQTESIVYAIQSVLSGVRAPTPSPTLNENLTQIITIVSSIVAVCNDNLPPASAQQGNDILRELSEHANKLSEVQAMPEVTKESRQIMAKSSFAVANAMKGLMKL